MSEQNDKSYLFETCGHNVGSATPAFLDGEYDSGLRQSNLPAGYTYFGQFIAHDLTNLNFRVRNADRTPSLDLDSVYGSGPVSSPLYYDQQKYLGYACLREGKGSIPDLPRLEDGVAIIPDSRNDDNVIIAQIHAAFIAAHNRTVERLMPDFFKGETPIWDKKIMEYYANEFEEEVDLPGLIGHAFKEINLVTAATALPSESAVRAKYQELFDAFLKEDLSQDQDETQQSYATPQVNTEEKADDLKIEYSLLGKEFISAKEFISHIKGLLKSNAFLDLERILFENFQFRTAEKSIDARNKKSFLRAFIAIIELRIKYYLQVFAKAKQATIRHYHYLIIQDYLKRILHPQVFKYYFQQSQEPGEPLKRFLYTEEFKQDIPFEFSMAAFRLGHSMVRSRYTFAEGRSRGLFRAKRKNQVRQIDFDWSFFFFFPDSEQDGRNQSAPIDLSISRPMLTNLGSVDEGSRNIIERNLTKGKEFKLICGQCAVKDLNNRLQESQIAPIAVLDETVLDDELEDYIARTATPLWAYILLEAQCQEGGKQLGKLGSYIVGEVLYGVIEQQDSSYLNQNPNWRPNLYHDDTTFENNGSTYSMIDFLKFAGVYEPTNT